MDLQYIKGKDMDDLEKRYPAAYHFLLDRVLRNEYISVIDEYNRLDRTPTIANEGRRNWLMDREQQLGQLFQLVPDGDNSVTIERKHPSEFGDYNGRKDII